MHCYKQLRNAPEIQQKYTQKVASRLLSGRILGGTQKFFIGFVQIARVAIIACSEVQTSPNPLVAWSLVVTLQIAQKAKLKQIIKCLRLIGITFIEKS